MDTMRLHRMVRHIRTQFIGINLGVLLKLFKQNLSYEIIFLSKVFQTFFSKIFLFQNIFIRHSYTMI